MSRARKASTASRASASSASVSASSVNSDFSRGSTGHSPAQKPASWETVHPGATIQEQECSSVLTEDYAHPGTIATVRLIGTPPSRAGGMGPCKPPFFQAMERQALRSCSRFQRHLAHVLASFEVGVGGSGIRQCKSPVHRRANLAGSDPRPDISSMAAVKRLFSCAGRARRVDAVNVRRLPSRVRLGSTATICLALIRDPKQRRIPLPLRMKELEQVGVELVLVRVGQAMRCAGINLEGRVGHKLG